MRNPPKPSEYGKETARIPSAHSKFESARFRENSEVEHKWRFGLSHSERILLGLWNFRLY